MLACCLLLFAFFRQGYSLYAIDRDILQWNASLDAAKAEQSTLNSQKDQLFDADYISILAREKLFFIYPGEKIWLLSSENQDILSSVETEGIIEE